MIGAGPIGLGVMAFAKEQGAKVIAMDVNDERLAFAGKWANADYTLNVFGESNGEISPIDEWRYAKRGI